MIIPPGIIFAVIAAIASIIGFFLGESVTLMKVLGLALVIAGSSILAAFSS